MRAVFALLTLACLALAGCNFLSSDAPEWSEQSAGKPALWLIEKDNKRAYLFGGIHALPQDITWQTPAIQKAMASSDQLILEVVGLEKDGAVTHVFSRLGQTPNQPVLSKRVSEELHAQANILQEKAGLSDLEMTYLESWAAALTFAAQSTHMLGISSEFGVERMLTLEFQSAGKPIRGLETVEQQLSYFDRLPELDQREMLNAVIRDADNAETAYRKLLTAWLTGDVDGLAAASESGILTRPNIREAVLVKRNAAWTDAIEKRLDAGALPLIAVGAAHLAGPDSVQSMLEKRGFKVSRLQ